MDKKAKLQQSIPVAATSSPVYTHIYVACDSPHLQRKALTVTTQ
jgi:hypothetical protein